MAFVIQNKCGREAALAKRENIDANEKIAWLATLHTRRKRKVIGVVSGLDQRERE